MFENITFSFVLLSTKLLFFTPAFKIIIISSLFFSYFLYRFFLKKKDIFDKISHKKTIFDIIISTSVGILVYYLSVSFFMYIGFKYNLIYIQSAKFFIAFIVTILSYYLTLLGLFKFTDVDIKIGKKIINKITIVLVILIFFVGISIFFIGKLYSNSIKKIELSEENTGNIDINKEISEYMYVSDPSEENVKIKVYKINKEEKSEYILKEEYGFNQIIHDGKVIAKGKEVKIYKDGSFSFENKNNDENILIHKDGYTLYKGEHSIIEYKNGDYSFSYSSDYPEFGFITYLYRGGELLHKGIDIWSYENNDYTYRDPNDDRNYVLIRDGKEIARGQDIESYNNGYYKYKSSDNMEYLMYNGKEILVDNYIVVPDNGDYYYYEGDYYALGRYNDYYYVMGDDPISHIYRKGEKIYSGYIHGSLYTKGYFSLYSSKDMNSNSLYLIKDGKKIIDCYKIEYDIKGRVDGPFPPLCYNEKGELIYGGDSK